MRGFRQFTAGFVALMIGAVVAIFGARAMAQSRFYSAPIDYSALSSTLVSQPPAQLRLPTLLTYTTPLPVDIYYGTGGVTSNVQGQRTGYVVNIQADPQTCRGALSCTAAYVDVTAIDSLSPSIQQQYSLFYNPAQLAGFRATAGHVPFIHRLSSGQSVTILPWTEAGAGMGYEKGIWDECDAQNICYRYVIGLKGGDPNALIAMLESVFSRDTRANGQGGGIVSGDWSQLVNPTDPRGQ